MINLLSLGKVLSKLEQQSIQGGFAITYWEDRTECIDDTRVWIYEDDPTAEELEAYNTVEC